ncbi:hypothetical protein GCM10022197_05430 [Microlunatus spumicola]|uniref:Asp23/Gls24 family envelope stress response protein n=1 Tax=Microlunatus spumicola TaxID=81499 RepID=A0ABP6WMW4_9ACTN
MAVSASTQLGCGRDIDDVWDNIDQPPTPHERTCPFCGPARDSLLALERATSQLRVADEEDPQLQAGPQVVARILEVARSEARRSRRLPLSKPLPGQVSEELTVSEQAVAAVLRRTGDRQDGVQVRRCSVELVTEPVAPGQADDPYDGDGPGGPPDGGEAAAGGDALRVPADVRVSLRVSVAAGVSIPTLSDELRRAVMDVIDREVGMNVVRVDIVVEDVRDV